MGRKTTTKYKVGDKVRVVKSTDFPGMIGKIWEVTCVQPPNTSFCCRVQQLPDLWNPLMYDWEIEKVATKGQQLLFSFMEGV